MKKTLLCASFCLVGKALLFAQFTDLKAPFAAPVNDVGYLSVPKQGVVWATGFTATVSQTFARTADGGQHWRVGQVPAPSADWDIASIVAVDSSMAWVTLFNNASGTLGAVYKTTDGGANWLRQGTAALFQNPNTSFANWTHFWNAQEGVTMGDPVGGVFEIWRTADGGDNWVRVPQANLPNPLAGEYGLTDGYTVKGDTVWCVTNKGGCLRSTDRGQHWAAFPTGHAGYYNIYMRDARNGVSVRSSGANPSRFRLTFDGGETWSAVYEGTLRDADFGIDGKFFMRHAQFVPGTHVLAGVGYDLNSSLEVLAVSQDDGMNFTVVGILPDDGSAGYIEAVSPSAVYLGTGTKGQAVVYKVDPLLTPALEPTVKAASLTLRTNPVGTHLTLVAQNPFDGTIELFQSNGALVRRHSSGSIPEGGQIELPVTGLPAGIYWLKVAGDGRVALMKVVKAVD